MHKKILSGLIAVGVGLMSISSHAVLLKQPGNKDNDAPLIYSTDPGAERFVPVGKLKTNVECTATLIAGSEKPDSQLPALILSAGHCASDILHTNQVIVDQPVEQTWSYTPNYFIDKQGATQPLAVTRIVYATMKQDDIAVFQLAATYGDLASQGIYPLLLQQNLQNENQSVELTHIPVEGVEESQRFLRHSECEITGRTPALYEGLFPWIWMPAYSVNCAGVAGGSSGSPVVLKDQTKIVGILNTTVTPGLKGCGLGRPCEITDNMPVAREGASYFTSIDRVARALTEQGKLDLTRLDNGQGDIINQYRFWRTQSRVNGEAAKWNLTLDEMAGAVRYKAGLSSETDCADINGYSNPVSAAEQPLMSLALPQQEGLYLLCIIRQNADNSWLSADQAGMALHQIDDTPPTVAPTFRVTEDEKKWFVFLDVTPYELDTVQVKYGPEKEVNCKDKQGYSLFLGVAFMLAKDQAPWRICTYGKDVAGNEGPVAEKILYNGMNTELADGQGNNSR